jgi:cell division protein ZapA (FtsZ GTPase activity inhibitor)
MTTKKHVVKVSILNEEYSIRSDTPPEHARAVAQYLDRAIRAVQSSGGVVETNRAVVLAALQITAELFEAKETITAANESIGRITEYVRPLLPPSKRTPVSAAAIPER